MAIARYAGWCRPPAPRSSDAEAIEQVVDGTRLSTTKLTASRPRREQRGNRRLRAWGREDGHVADLRRRNLDRNFYSGPEHVRCNRATASRVRENGIIWSRKWYDHPQPGTRCGNEVFRDGYWQVVS